MLSRQSPCQTRQKGQKGHAGNETGQKPISEVFVVRGIWCDSPHPLVRFAPPTGAIRPTHWCDSPHPSWPALAILIQSVCPRCTFAFNWSMKTLFTDGTGGVGVSAAMPGVWRRHPADRVYHGARADPEDPYAHGRASRAASAVTCARPAYRLGRARAGVVFWAGVLQSPNSPLCREGPRAAPHRTPVNRVRKCCWPSYPCASNET